MPDTDEGEENDSARDEPAERRWCVVGGSDKGGILVRTGKATSSPEADSRLATGALVREELVDGDRLSFTKLKGDGPETGWVSIRLKDKVLMERAPLLEPKEADAGREAGVFAEPPPPAPASRRIRVLCLHGTAASVKVFETQLRMLTKALSDDVEFLYLDGCLTCDPSNPIVGEQVQLMSKYFPGETFKQWAEPVGEKLGWRKYDGIEGGIETCQRALREMAPIDAVLGFSQGSNVAHSLAAMAALGKGALLRCVVHICTAKPGWVAQMPELFEWVIPLPALIIDADKDATSVGSDEVAATYEAAQRFTFAGEHRPLPQKPDAAKEVCELVKDFLLKTCRE